MINEPDARLYDMLAMVNSGFVTSMTISVAGVIYSGMMVSERVWFEENKKLIEAADVDHKQNYIDYYNHLIADFDANSIKTATTLHMKDVKILSHPSADMPLFLWRIRIDRVDGFHVGRAQ